MHDPGRRKLRKILKQHVSRIISTKAYDHSFLMKSSKTAPAGKNGILKSSTGHEKTAFMAEDRTFKAGYRSQLLSFQAQPGRRKAAFIIHGIFFFLWLDTVAASVGRKDHKSDIGFRKTLLAGNEFRKYQDIGILSRSVSGSEGSVMFCKDFFYSSVCTFVSKVTLELVFQDHASDIDCLEKGLVVAAFGIPSRIKIADQRGKFIFFTGIVIDIQWLDKGFIKFLCQLLTEDFRPEFFPEKTKCRIGNAVVTDTAVFLVVVILPSSNIKNKTFIIFRNNVSTCYGDLRIQI